MKMGEREREERETGKEKEGLLWNMWSALPNGRRPRRAGNIEKKVDARSFAGRFWEREERKERGGKKVMSLLMYVRTQ